MQKHVEFIAKQLLLAVLLYYECVCLMLLDGMEFPATGAQNIPANARPCDIDIGKIS